MEKTSLCYCDTEMAFEACCAPILKGDRFARTAQELLRARFSAFPVRNADFLMHTHHPDTRHEVVREDLEAWMESSVWQRLEIHEASGGGEDDMEGTIFFTAYFTKKEGGLEQKHSEKSYFKKYEGEWRFWDAEAIHFGTYQRPEPKIGRNDICPCGSGKKFKKCCCR